MEESYHVIAIKIEKQVARSLSRLLRKGVSSLSIIRIGMIADSPSYLRPRLLVHCSKSLGSLEDSHHPV